MAWSAAAAAVLAHQGGWDEMLMVAVPIAVFAGLLYSANKRAARLEAERQDGAADPGAGDRTGTVEDGEDGGTSAPAARPEPRNERAGPL